MKITLESNLDDSQKKAIKVMLLIMLSIIMTHVAIIPFIHHGDKFPTSKLTEFTLIAPLLAGLLPIAKLPVKLRWKIVIGSTLLIIMTISLNIFGVIYGCYALGACL